MFSLQLFHRKVQFTACGFFPLDFTLLYAVRHLCMIYEQYCHTAILYALQVVRFIFQENADLTEHGTAFAKLNKHSCSDLCLEIVYVTVNHFLCCKQ
jgi:hypothetical protein